MWLAVKVSHLAETTRSHEHFVKLLILFLEDANQVNYLELNSD
jgi:hypothetical protein